MRAWEDRTRQTSEEAGDHIARELSPANSDWVGKTISPNGIPSGTVFLAMLSKSSPMYGKPDIFLVTENPQEVLNAAAVTLCVEERIEVRYHIRQFGLWDGQCHYFGIVSDLNLCLSTAAANFILHRSFMGYQTASLDPRPTISNSQQADSLLNQPVSPLHGSPNGQGTLLQVEDPPSWLQPPRASSPSVTSTTTIHPCWPNTETLPPHMARYADPLSYPITTANRDFGIDDEIDNEKACLYRLGFEIPRGEKQYARFSLQKKRVVRNLAFVLGLNVKRLRSKKHKAMRDDFLGLLILGEWLEIPEGPQKYLAKYEPRYYYQEKFNNRWEWCMPGESSPKEWNRGFSQLKRFYWHGLRDFVSCHVNQPYRPANKEQRLLEVRRSLEENLRKRMEESRCLKFWGVFEAFKQRWGLLELSELIGEE